MKDILRHGNDSMTNFKRDSLGNVATAEAIAERAERGVVAYRDFVRNHGSSPSGPFNKRPIMDKPSYLATYGFHELLGDDFDQTFTIFKSSGSSGHSFYWPQLKETNRATGEFLRAYLERSFAIHHKRTLAIVGLALGSWIGGEHFSWALKSVALTAPYPFSIFSPGSCHDEIIEMIRRSSRFVDQIVLVVCPSAIGHILLRAEQSQRPLPLDKMRYLVLGEPFPESLRTSLQHRAGLAPTESPMFSVFGSADTGTLGVESAASVALRKLIEASPELADSLALPTGSAPHFFHCCAQDAYLESVKGELLVTRWQGIPLVRYNLHDSACFYNWAAVRQAVLKTKQWDADGEALRAVIDHAGPDLPDLLAIAGRADACLILCGTNLSESMLDAAVRCEALNAFLTGIYKARILHEDDRQYLALDLELCSGVAADPSTTDLLYKQLVEALGREQPEFLDDWRNVYSTWDSDSQRRILRLNCVAWPALSEDIEKQIKQRGTRA